jgi:CTP synthase
MMVSGINPRRNLVEIIELKNHPWFVAVQFHPEFQSKPNQPHPLFAAFIGAAIKNKKSGAKEKGVAKSSTQSRKGAKKK